MNKNNTERKFGIQDFQDLALIESVKRGNQHAFELLYKKYYPHMHKKIFFALKNKHDAEDVVSEIFQKIYENIGKYKKDYTFNAWITRLANNYMIDFIRKNQRNVLVKNSISIDVPVDNQESEFEIQIPSNDPEILTASESIERLAKLKVAYNAIENLTTQAIDNLPVMTGFVFKKFHLDGKTPIEISDELNLNLKDVEDHIKKGYERYDQARLEQRILEMYLKEELPYDVIAKKVKMNLNTLKVTLMRAKDKVVKSINLHLAAIEVSGVYNLEQLNVDDWYTVLKFKENS